MARPRQGRNMAEKPKSIKRLDHDVRTQDGPVRLVEFHRAAASSWLNQTTAPYRRRRSDSRRTRSLVSMRLIELRLRAVAVSMERMDRRVASGSARSSVAARTLWASSAAMVRGAPGRGASTDPSNPRPTEPSAPPAHGLPRDSQLVGHIVATQSSASAGMMHAGGAPPRNAAPGLGVPRVPHRSGQRCDQSAHARLLCGTSSMAHMPVGS